MDNRIILCAGKLHYRVTLRHPHLYRLQLVEATKVISYVETGESFTVHCTLLPESISQDAIRQLASPQSDSSVND